MNIFAPKSDRICTPNGYVFEYSYFSEDVYINNNKLKLTFFIVFFLKGPPGGLPPVSIRPFC
jgi:hypothetical protein